MFYYTDSLRQLDSDSRDDREIDLFMAWHFDLCEAVHGNVDRVLDMYEHLFASLTMAQMAEQLTIAGALAPLCVCNEFVFGGRVPTMPHRSAYLQQVRERLIRDAPATVDALLQGL